MKFCRVRTKSKRFAQELYYELGKKAIGYFFARKSLESKLGAEYEPIIFAALNSAKVMIVLGTKAENFNAVWVRNEWSRFMHMSKDAHKIIIPTYRGISPYELPVELSALQSQDMSKIGFMQDLTDGIERCLRGERSKNAAKAEPVQSYGATPLERLLQNSSTYLNIGNYASAEEVFTTITKDYPEEYRGWWGLIVCNTNNFSNVMLDQTQLNIWYRYAKRLAPPDEFVKLEEKYVEYTRNVSKLAAIDDIRSINVAITNHNSRINSVTDNIRSLHNDIQRREKEWRQQNEDDQMFVTHAEYELKDLGKQRVKKIIGLTIGWLLIIIGFLILKNGGWNIFFGIVIGAIGFFVIRNNTGLNSNSF